MPQPILHLDLYRIADLLDDAVARAEDTPEWYTDVEVQLLAYRSLLQTHSEDDAYQDLIEAAPRVTSIVDRLKIECDELEAVADRALDALHAAERSPRTLSLRLRELIQLTNRHRSRTINLVHETYAVDIGGTD